MPESFRRDRVELCHAVAGSDRLVLRGPDAPDFLHRISASEVRDLAPGMARHIVFTHEKGGLVGAPLALVRDDGFHLVCGPGRGEDLRAWLQKWIIVEEVEVLADDEPAWRLGEPGLGTGCVVRPTTAAGPAVQFGGDPPPVSGLEEWEAALFRAGRFHSGRATALGPIPLELGWRDLVSFSKGCYIGQEVIARMENYDKVRRRLAAAILLAPLAAGTRLKSGGKSCGMLLSSVQLDEGPFGWVLVDRELPDDAVLDAGHERAGTLLRAPAD